MDTVSLLTSPFCVSEADTVNQKSDPLLANLQSVFVQSTDPAAAAAASAAAAAAEVRPGHGLCPSA